MEKQWFCALNQFLIWSDILPFSESISYTGVGLMSACDWWSIEMPGRTRVHTFFFSLKVREQTSLGTLNCDGSVLLVA